LTFRQAPQQKLLRDATIKNRIHQQNVATLQIGARSAEKNLSPRVLTLFHVADQFADEVANERRSNLPHEISGENKSAIHRNHYVETAATVRASAVFADRRHARGNSCFGK